jgi:hypothetical protein
MFAEVRRVSQQFRGGRRALFLALIIVSCGPSLSSGDDEDTEYSSARLLDRICESGQYELHGSAEIGRGLSADSFGFALGPEAGSVDLLLMPPSGSQTSALVTLDDSDPTWTGDYGTSTIANPPGHVLKVLDLRVTATSSSGCSVAPGFRQ